MIRATGDLHDPAEMELLEKLRNHPKLQYRVKGERMRDVFAMLHSSYALNPQAQVSEREILEKVFFDEPSSGATHARKTVGRLRDWLNHYFQKEAPNSSLLIQIPKGEYRFQFIRKNPQLAMTPTEWFWEPYRTNVWGRCEFWIADEIPVWEDSYIDVTGTPENLPKFTYESVLRAYQSFVNVVGEVPAIEQGGAQILEGAERKLIIGEPGIGGFDPKEIWDQLRGRSLSIPLTIGRDHGGAAYIVDPEPNSGAPGLYLDRGEIFALVTRICRSDGAVTTFVQSSSGYSIESVLSTLTDDILLEPIATLSQLGGSTLEQTVPPIMQLVFSSESGFKLAKVISLEPIKDTYI